MSENPIGGMSPLETVSFDRFKGRTYPNEFVTNVPASVGIILPNNPNRLFWIMINEDVGDCRVSMDPAITVSSGWLLAANGGVISMFWEDDGEAVGYPVYAISAAGGAKIRVREVVRS